MADEQKRELTDEVREHIRKVAERMVDNSPVPDEKREDAVAFTIETLEKMHREGLSIDPPTAGENVPYLKWKDGEWELKKDWLDEEWKESDRFLPRRK